MKDFTYITNSSPEFIENLYRDFVNDPEKVDPELRKFFEGFDFAISSHAVNGASTPLSTSVSLQTEGRRESTSTSPSPSGPLSAEQLAKEFSVYNLILAYRKKGHLTAK